MELVNWIKTDIMEEALYQKLLDDESVIKYSDCMGGHFKNDELEIVVYILFNHIGYFPVQNNFLFGKRLFLHVYPLKNLTTNKILMKKIANEAIILVNSNHPEYAMTFKLYIDPSIRSVSVILDQYPQMGEALITEEEKEGIAEFF